MHGCGDWTPERRPTLRAAPLRLGRLLRSHPKLRSTTLRVGKIGEPPGITIAHLTLLDYTASGNTRFGATNPGAGQQRVTVSSGARRAVCLEETVLSSKSRWEPFLKDDASGYHLLRSVENRKRVWDWNPFPGRTTVEGKFGWFGESG